MDAAGDVGGQFLLEQAGAGVLRVGGLNLLDARPVEQGEDADVPGGVLVGRIDPVLVEFVGAGEIGRASCRERV